jgi:hypothetical protein
MKYWINTDLQISYNEEPKGLMNINLHHPQRTENYDSRQPGEWSSNTIWIEIMQLINFPPKNVIYDKNMSSSSSSSNKTRSRYRPFTACSDSEFNF